MDNREAVNWLINISADIGKAEHSDLWHYEQALTEIKDMLESAQLSQEGTTISTCSVVCSTDGTISREDALLCLTGIISDMTIKDYIVMVSKRIRNLPPAHPEITQEQLEEYCKKRCLTVITDDLYYKLTSGSKNTATWLIRKWGDDAKCSNCGHTFKDVYDMDNHDRFCRFCGSKMEGIETIK